MKQKILTINKFNLYTSNKDNSQNKINKNFILTEDVIQECLEDSID